jgi:hypothetical protein
MPSITDANCVAVLNAAASAELGLVIRTNDPVRARTALYSARLKIADTELQGLQIRVSPNDPEGEIWLINTARVNRSIV